MNGILDEIAEQRDLLRSRRDELETKISNEHFKTIDDWEKMMQKTLTAGAQNAREQFRHLIISAQITSFRADDNCFETDLEQLQLKIKKIK